MSAYKTRKENLKLLIEKWGGVTSLSKKLGHSTPSYLSQLTGPHASRDITERSARKIEAALDLKPGWLDADHSAAVHRPTGEAKSDIDPDRLAECIEMVGALCEALGVRVNPIKFSDLVTLAYQDTRSAEERRLYLQRIIKLMS